jgi:glycosyltransferase involved in cell wall biosynthesis
MKKILEQRGFKNVVIWHRGVDLETFKPYSQTLNEPKPILLYVGRISTEKNIKSFIDLNIRGTKIIVGDGPERKKLEDQYPSIKFLGSKSGESLARAYSEGDVFVFPSKSDTYGLVLLEALACGVPVAAYPEPGPLDILANSDASKCVFVDEDLEVAVKRALLTKYKKECHELAKVFSWENCTNTFLKYLTESHKV